MTYPSKIFTDTQAAFIALNIYGWGEISRKDVCEHQAITEINFIIAAHIKKLNPDIATTLFNGGAIDIGLTKPSTDLRAIYDYMGELETAEYMIA